MKKESQDDHGKTVFEILFFINRALVWDNHRSGGWVRFCPLLMLHPDEIQAYKNALVPYFVEKEAGVL